MSSSSGMSSSSSSSQNGSRYSTVSPERGREKERLCLPGDALGLGEGPPRLSGLAAPGLTAGTGPAPTRVGRPVKLWLCVMGGIRCPRCPPPDGDGAEDAEDAERFRLWRWCCCLGEPPRYP